MYHSCFTKFYPVCHPWSHYSYYPYPYFGFPSSYSACCPVCYQPYHLCCCKKSYMMLPQELFVDPATSPKERFVGGIEDVRLTLEYMKTGASPKVKITITDAEGTTVWDVTTIPDGYHVKDKFATVSPGAKIKVEVTDCRARLRWCEIISC